MHINCKQKFLQIDVKFLTLTLIGAVLLVRGKVDCSHRYIMVHLKTECRTKTTSSQTLSEGPLWPWMELRVLPALITLGLNP